MPARTCALVLAVLAASVLALPARAEIEHARFAELLAEAAIVKPNLKAAIAVTRKAINAAIGRDVTEALTVYLGILIVAGAAVGWMRTWPAALWTTIAGATLWSLLGAWRDESLKTLLLGLEPMAAITVLAWVRPRTLRGFVGPGDPVI